MYIVGYKLANYHMEVQESLDDALARIIELASKGYPELYLKRRDKR